MNKKIIIFIIVNLILLLILYNMPMESPIGSICIYKRITGKECFNCGMTRAFLSILHFRFQDAINYNWKVIIIFPYTVIVYLHSWYKYIIKKEKINE
ncbi:MAG: DUF2752 domain-containing protein [Clostridia bacterium]|jgi:hypothetical protein|nr:pF10825 family protein [Clostridium sp. CAG:571]HJJ06486.1 DUF2752 domain-containing protein [Clostridiaceae bacterium]HJJ14014.1 DUF2752 domain-containing protein [Clostridiaceae bacterium]